MKSSAKSTPAEDLPVLGHNQPQIHTRDKIIEKFTEDLLRERSADTPCYLDSIFRKAEITVEAGSTARDALLTDLFLFEDNRLPKISHTFNGDLGNLTEKFIVTLFEMSRVKMIDSGTKIMAGLEKESEAFRSLKIRKGFDPAKFPKWKHADFLMGENIVECKYRYGSGNDKWKQIKVAELYRELGLTPVFLHLSPDFRWAEEFRAGGWEVYTGEDMIEYVSEHTGYDFRDLLREVSAQPLVRKRILDAHVDLIETQKAELWRDYKYAPAEIREQFTKDYLNDPESLSGLEKQLSSSPPTDIRIDIEGLRCRTEHLCNEATRTLPQTKKDALMDVLMNIDEDQRAELLSEALSKSSTRTQMAVMSVFG